MNGDTGVAAVVRDQAIAVEVDGSADWGRVDAAAKRVLDTGAASCGC